MKLTACDEQDVNEIVDDRRCAEGTKQSLITQAEKCEVKSELGSTAQSIKKPAAFTLAEILLSLTVIGIVAAIALPSLLGNANERAWETQKKALYTRFSQALPLLPSLNGYGELVGNLSDCEDTNSCHSESELKDTAAETFVRDGLSKVMKVTNICDSEHLGDCGLPDKIIPLNGGSAINLSSIKSLATFNDDFSEKISVERLGINYEYEQLDTKAAAFETVNSESILVYYNPNCTSNLNISNYTIYDMIFPQAGMCANFVYDLNGKKGPNTVGKDIGFISAMYSTDSVIVSPNPYPNDASDSASQTEAAGKCKEFNQDAKVPNIYELSSIFYNQKILGLEENHYWSSNSVSDTLAWAITSWAGMSFVSAKTETKRLRCIKR